MKTKYTNSEKVSPNFLKLKCDELLGRFEKYVKADLEFIVKQFIEKLDLMRMDAEHLGGDNYEKLKSLIHFEREFDEYLGSKELFWNLINLGLESLEIDSNWVLRRVFVSLKDGRWEEVYKFLDAEFLNCESGFSFKDTVKNLTDEDIAKLERMLREYYREEFFSKVLTGKKTSIFNVEHKLFDLETHVTLEQLFVARTYLDTYLEVFDYGMGNQLSRNFEAFLKEVSSDITNFCILSNDPSFWRLLVDFYTLKLGTVENNRVDKEEDWLGSFGELKRHYQEDDDISSGFENAKLRKVTMEEFLKLADKKMLINFDLRGLDLSDFYLADFVIINCNMENTHAVLDFNHLNAEQSIYYIRGNKVELDDLTNCCFKGCNVELFTSNLISNFRFSANTFDENVLEACGLRFDCDEVVIKEMFYRKIMPKSLEMLEVMLSALGMRKIVERYENITDCNEFAWLFLFEKVFPNSMNKLFA